MMPLFNPRDVVACIHAFPERIIDIFNGDEDPAGGTPPVPA